MELIIDPYHSLPCELATFTINGKAANKDDFGDVYDHNKEEIDETDDVELYGCVDVQFDPKPPTAEVLQRYNITVDEYNTICRKLENELCIGRCGWCI